MQLLDTDLSQNEAKTDSELGSLFLKPNKLGAICPGEASKNNYWDAKDPKNRNKERPFKTISRVMTWPIYSFDEQCIKIFALDLASIRKQLLDFAAEEGYEQLSDWNWKLTQKKEMRGEKEFTSYTLIPKPQSPKHKAEVKKAYDQRLEDGFYLENLLVGGNPLEEMAD